MKTCDDAKESAVMGEAKLRREAMAAGRPWPKDSPKTDPRDGQYLGDDGKWHPRESRPRQSSGQLALLAVVAGMADVRSIRQRLR